MAYRISKSLYESEEMANSITINAAASVTYTKHSLQAILTIICPDTQEKRADFVTPNLWRWAAEKCRIEPRYVKNLSEDIARFAREAKSGEQRDFILAQGVAPQHGAPSQLVLHVDFNMSPGKIDPKTGVMDFKERDLVKEVEEGTLLLEVHKPTLGIAGENIFGKEIEANDGDERTLVELDGGVRVEETPLGKSYFAAIKGVALFLRTKLSVSQVLRINQDVDYSTGHIRFDGSVVVSGNVLGGFRVEAKGDVLIEGFVESKAVIEGNNVVLKKGCYGIVHARRNLQASFLERATVSAGRSIAVKKALRSRLTGQSVDIDMVTASYVTAYESLSILVVNPSDMVPTHLTLRYDPNVLEWLNQLRSEYSNIKFRQELLSLQMTDLKVDHSKLLAGELDLTRLSHDQQNIANLFLKNFRLLRRFRSAIKSTMKKCVGTINIPGKIAAMTVIDTYGLQQVIFTPLTGRTYSYNPELHEIVEGNGRID
ncbi:DUF342 domain-containing protein [Chrysiogenes arsenatis]|uniref:DUF342 domain-containing protein n=1 Tax=Chrysiogenes arsenatis TaxID=309797 RepID=UPI0003FA3286|nr:FapA family protein [Chrysiogenes arsenatis]